MSSEIPKRVEFTEDDVKRLRELFKKIDRNNDGRIDIDDLCAALKQRNVTNVSGHAEAFLKHDADKDGKIDFQEFLHYAQDHVDKLRMHFRSVDTNRDGTIDASEIQASFKELGIHIDRPEAEKLLARMDKDGSYKVDWAEWRDYLLLSPSADLHDILHYWRHSTIIDIGENAIIPDDFTEKEMQTGMWWRHLVAGGAAGGVSRTATAPLDRLKILYQVHATSKNKFTISKGFQKMVEEGGIRSMWRGNGINVLKIAPESALKFMAYEKVKTLFRGDSNRDIAVWERFASGSLAGIISQSVIYPMEVLKTRLALRKTGQYSGIFDCGVQVFKNEGIKTFYRGYIPNVLGIIPYAGTDLAIYETLKMYIGKKNQNKDPDVMTLLFCGAVSSTCGQMVSYPLALIRTKMQADARSAGKKSSALEILQRIIKDDGARGLYRGITANFLKVIPAVSISYVVYEKFRQSLGVKMT